MNIYLVGGAVRDMLMGNDFPADLDFVVVGSSPEQMIADGYQQVGADFPVFLKNGFEFALARTERKSGNGHTAFTCETANVTLEDDLARRDLTINAVALDQQSSTYIDPFGGRNDIRDRILRHVTDEGFVEDPLRVLRLARFCAKFPSFTVAPETIQLCRKMVADGMLSHLTAERVFKEMEKALQHPHASRFFIFLRIVGALPELFPEVANLCDVPAGSYQWHPEGDTFTHTMLVMDQYAQIAGAGGDAIGMFCALAHDFGKGTTKPDLLPKHYGHEVRGVPLVEQIGHRLKMPTEWIREAKIAAEFHTHVHNVYKMRSATIVKMFENLGGNRLTTESIIRLVRVSMADTRGRGSFYSNIHYPNADTMYYALQACRVNARDVCEDPANTEVSKIRHLIQQERVRRVTKALHG